MSNSCIHTDGLGFRPQYAALLSHHSRMSWQHCTGFDVHSHTLGCVSNSYTVCYTSSGAACIMMSYMSMKRCQSASMPNDNMSAQTLPLDHKAVGQT